MSLSWVSKREREIVEVLRKLLCRDEWYTLNELSNMVGGDPVDTMLAFRHIRRGYPLLQVRGPSETLMTTLWRGDAGDSTTKRLLDEETVDVWDLPSTLRKSFTAKYCEAHWKHPLERAPWKLVHIATTVDDALEKTGLHTEHPRPTDGFPFQCVWRTNEPLISGSNFSIGLTFTGTIRTDDFEPYRRIYGTHQVLVTIPGSHMMLKVRQNFTTLDALVGWVTVNRYNNRLTHCPTRSDFIEKTNTALLKHASRQEIAAPFTPIRCGFRLLSGNGYGGNDA